MLPEVKKIITKELKGSNKIIFLKCHQIEVEKFLNENFELPFFNNLIKAVVKLSYCKSYSSIQKIYNSLNFSQNTDDKEIKLLWEKYVDFIGRYAKYGEFFVEISKDGLFLKQDVAKYEKYMIERKLFPKDMTANIRKEKVIIEITKEKQMILKLIKENYVIEQSEKNNEKILKLREENKYLHEQYNFLDEAGRCLE